MEYQLGDFVEINKRWKKQAYPFVFEDEKAFFKYCEENNHEEGIPITIMKKIPHSEKGFICGKRSGIKTYHVLNWSEGTDVGIGVVDEGFYTSDEEYQDMYLVATRMNCIYRVSKEDIKILKDVEELYNE